MNLIVCLYYNYSTSATLIAVGAGRYNINIYTELNII